jgi:hypothetical protein
MVTLRECVYHYFLNSLLLTKIRENCRVITCSGEEEKRTPKENVDGRSTSSHDNKKFRIRSVEKQRGKAFGFRLTATAVKNTG